MCTAFPAVEQYLSLCDKLNVKENILMNASDQQVPQFIDLSDESLDVNQKAYQGTGGPADLWGYPDEVKPSVYSTDNAFDHELSNDATPDLLDLDQYNEACFIGSLDTEDLTSLTPASHVTRSDYLNVGGMQVVGSMILDLKRKSIEDLCKTLNIRPDPKDWSCDHVMLWIASVCRQYNCPLDVLSVFQNFQLNGQTLCDMSEIELKNLCPRAGPTLFSELEMWKTVWSLGQQEERFEHSSYQAATVDMSCVKYEPCLSPTYSEESYTASSTSSLSSPTSSTKMEDVLSESWGLSSGVATTQPRQHKRLEHKQTIQLWRFLKELLHQPEVSCGAIKWVNEAKGIFKIEDSSRVAKLWGKRKNRPLMNYDKLSRSIRQYYKKGIIKKTEQSKRLVYQFCDGYL